MKQGLLTLALISGLLGCQSTHDDKAHSSTPTKASWSYTGSTGPAHWGDLSADYALARTGKHQSPIDISTARCARKDLPPMKVSYAPTSLEILNNGHTVEDDYHNGGSITVDGQAYKLAQFHFHSPSEHTIDGQHAPMEMHLVHKDAAGKLAVVGVMIREGRTNPELATLWQHMPTTAGRTEAVSGVNVNAAKLLPASLASYRYSGSLTTPPCSEQVDWMVLQQPIEASADQIAAFRQVISGNNRPTQPLNDRVVTASN